jgi:hypothetical protein
LTRHSTLPLPARRHVPGSGSQPDAPPLAAARADPQGLAYGIDLYNRGFFWEAHEVWEAVWLASAPNSGRRQGLRMLIQMANAGLKLAMGKPRAFARLAGEVAALARDADLAAEGLDVAAMAAAFADFAGAVATAPSCRGLPVIALRQ